jgi:phosphate transport system ATP-binding protein
VLVDASRTLIPRVADPPSFARPGDPVAHGAEAAPEGATMVPGPANDPARPERSAATAPAAPPATALEVRDYSLFYGSVQALKSVTMAMDRHSVTAIIGPSGCGKSTLLRSFNRMNDLIPGVRVEGAARAAGLEVFAPQTDVVELRRRVGMVFQRPNPFPKSIFENVVFGLRMLGVTDRKELGARAEAALRRAALWDEVKDRIDRSALQLSGGQQQRLCIARALAVEPEVILMDEPASALDPTATARIEELVLDLKERYTIVVVTHNMQQAARISDHTAFMLSGTLVEHDETKRLFRSPRERLTEDYITGRFG